MRWVDRALEGIKDQIARNAESFPILPGSTFRMAKTDAYGIVPRLRIIFEITDYDAVLLAAIRVDDDSDIFDWT